jgi:uncharacterized OB-fold protein
VAERPYPEPDPETRHFWDAVAAGRLDIQRCQTCGRHVFYPRGSVCPHCGGRGLDWVTAAGGGVVHSFTVVHRAPPEFAAEAPYVVALIDLDEGPRMMSRLTGVEPAEVAVGMPVELSISGDPPLPYFTNPRRT